VERVIDAQYRIFVWILPGSKNASDQFSGQSIAAIPNIVEIVFHHASRWNTPGTLLFSKKLYTLLHRYSCLMPCTPVSAGKKRRIEVYVA
jgi:hypothetical protein